MTTKCTFTYFLTFRIPEAAPPVAYVQYTYIPDDPENFGARVHPPTWCISGAVHDDGEARLQKPGASANISTKLVKDNWGVAKQWVVLRKSDGSSSSAC